MPLILGTNSIKDTGYDVANSCRFNSGSSDNLSIALSSTATNTKKGTLSFWFKSQGLNFQFPIAKGAGTVFYLYFNSSNQLVWQNGLTNTRITTQVFRDPTAWGNLVVNFDTTQATASNRQKMFYNGVEITSFGTSNDLSEDQVISIFDGDSNTRAISGYVGGGYYSGYICEVVGIDGEQLDPTSFGEFDSDSPNIWKPKSVSGLSFGNNGFYLEFKQSGTSANSSGLGADTSGNDHHFTVNNLTAEDQSLDTCTNNFATLNPLVQAGSVTSGATHTFSNGNLTLTGGTNKWIADYGTFALTTGKWFYEVKLTTFGNPSGSPIRVGWGAINDVVKDNNIYFRGLTYDLQGIVRYGSGGTDGGTTTGRTAFVQGDIVSIAIDIDNDEITFYKNGSVTNVEDFDYSSLTTNIKRSLGFAIAPHIVMYANNSNAVDYNFGSPPYSESGGNSDGNGYGNFSMAVPSGYFALNTKNLAEYG